MAVIKVSKLNFDSEVLESEKPVLVDFFANWCGPCKIVSPIIDEIAAEMPTLKVVKVNVDDEPELAQAFGVMSIPTFLIIKGGKVVNKSTGAHPKEDIIALIEG